MSNDSLVQSPIKNISAKNFRNIGSLMFSPGENINIIYGDNARGKTNLIEAIWLFTGEKSFRNVKDSSLIKIGENEALLSLNFFAEERLQTSSIKFSPKRSIELNKCPVKSIVDFIGTFSAVIFSPEDLSLVKGSPQKRRDFLDIAISQIRPRYAKLLLEYDRILAQRNTLLKDISRYPSLLETLDIWDEAFAKISTNVTSYRLKYLNAVSPIAQEIYDGISSSRETLKIKFPFADELETSPSTNDLFLFFSDKIRDSRQNDIKYGFSLVGPHRDDFNVFINDLLIKNFASQGQMRSVALSLKLAEALVLKRLASKNPVILLDDVFSELDSSRQKYILKFLRDYQCFITCCDKSYFDNISSNTAIHKIDELF